MADTDLHILYLHGFLSSPESKKAKQTLAYCQQRGMAERLHIPTMLEGPAATMLELETEIEQIPSKNLAVIGSSLGGFYATFLAEKYDLPAVLINPAVQPFELWEDYLGEHKNFYNDHVHIVTRDHIAELQALHCAEITRPQNFMVLLQTADEVLDYKLAAQKFQDSQCVIQQGGDHSFQEYQAELPGIFDFLLSRIGTIAR